MSSLPKDLAEQIAALKVLIVDDQHSMRKVIRTMLAGVGVRSVFEAGDGEAGLRALSDSCPDIVIVDWDMPLIDGIEFVRVARTPGQSVSPGIPIIMLTGHADNWRVVEATRYGVHEFLVKPVSTKALLDRIINILRTPRPMMMVQNHYIPAPRRLVVLEDSEKLQAKIMPR